MKAVVHVDGGPLDGSYQFDDYNPANLNNTGLDQASNEFFAWLLLDGAYCTGKGQVGYVQGGMSPASMQRRLSGEKDFKAGPCNYWLTEWEQKEGSISARFRNVEWGEVERFRTARTLQTWLGDLKTKIESHGESPPSMDLINAMLRVIEMQQRYIGLLDPSQLIALWTRPKNR
jgi:hypothetical protein